ncbi:unnamed protein product, partial [Rotaria magnacalcarata]
MHVEDSDIEEVDVSDLPNIDRLETRNNVDHNNSNNHNNDADDDYEKNQQGQRQMHREHRDVVRSSRKPMTQQGEKEMDLNIYEKEILSDLLMAETNKDKQSTVNENINWNTVEDFDDIFDIVDDDNDTLEYEEDELNKYYLSGHLNSMAHEDEMIDDDSYDNDLNVIEEIQTEAILSQKFSQLSTKSEHEQKSGVTHKKRWSTAIASPDVSSKKAKMIVDNDDDHD